MSLYSFSASSFDFPQPESNSVFSAVLYLLHIGSSVSWCTASPPYFPSAGTYHVAVCVLSVLRYHLQLKLVLYLYDGLLKRFAALVNIFRPKNVRSGTLLPLHHLRHREPRAAQNHNKPHSAYTGAPRMHHRIISSQSSCAHTPGAALVQSNFMVSFS